jgi:uroporphyrinogen decarboxylase
MAYARLKKFLGIKTGNIYVYDMVQQLAIVEKTVLDALRVDTIELGRGFMLDEKEWKDWGLPDGTLCKIPFFVNVEKRAGDWLFLSDDGRELGVQRKGCVFFEQTYWPLAKRDFAKENFRDLESAFTQTQWTGIPTPGYHLPLDEAGLKQFAQGAKSLRESTDRAIIGLFGGNLFETPQMLYGMENYLSYLAQYPEAAAVGGALRPISQETGEMAGCGRTLH